MERLPGGGGHLGRDGERIVAPGRRVVVREVVDELLDADRVQGRPHPVLDEAPHIRVRRPIHVDGEGRQRVVLHRHEVVLGDVSVRLAVGVFVEGDRRVHGGAGRKARDLGSGAGGRGLVCSASGTLDGLHEHRLELHDGYSQREVEHVARRRDGERLP